MPKKKKGVKFRVPCFFIGVTQLAVVTSSIYEKVWSLILLEEPVDAWQHVSMILLYGLEVAIACILIKGSYTGDPASAVPWLLTITPFFCIATMYAVIYASEEETGQIVLNFFVVAAIWLAWYVVLRFYLENRKKRKR